MSKKAIKLAVEQVNTSGYLAGMAMFKGGDSEIYRKDVLKYAEALSMLGIMDWAKAYELMAEAYDKGADAGFNTAKAVADYRAANR